MVGLQRRVSEPGGVVLEGRDIGSVVLPSAQVKVYIDASCDERAERRRKELSAKGVEKRVDEIREDIERRDHFDSTREHSPLKIPVGAHVVDTTSLTIEEQVDKVVGIARTTANELFSRVAKPGQRAELTKKTFHYELIRRFALVVTKVFWGLRIRKKDTTPYVENFIYASNHRSNADPSVIAGTVTREMAFVAKRKLFNIPLFGALIRSLNAFPTRRDIFDRGAMEHSLSELSNGRSLLIFPEGHRVSGKKLGSGKPGIGYLALNSGVAVVPVFLDGTENLKKALIRRPRITVIHGRPIRLADPSRIDPTSENCREFTNMVMCAIGALGQEHDQSR
jgi:cytidylate kinase